MATAGRRFSCAVDWIQDKTSDVHNVPVACELIVLLSLWLDLVTTDRMEQSKANTTEMRFPKLKDEK